MILIIVSGFIVDVIVHNGVALIAVFVVNKIVVVENFVDTVVNIIFFALIVFVVLGLIIDVHNFAVILNRSVIVSCNSSRTFDDEYDVLY